MVLATSARKDNASASGKMDLKSCQSIAATLKDVNELPKQCETYPSVMKTVKQKKDEQAVAVAFAGMHPGSAVRARRSRATGYESPDKLKRRLTSTGASHAHHPQKSG